jgi:hypothetical protein
MLFGLSSCLFSPSSLGLPALTTLVHVFDLQFCLQPVYLYGSTHNFPHSFLSKLFFVDFKLLQPFIIRLKVHKFVSDSLGLSLSKSLQHLLLTLPISLNVVNFPYTILENVVAFVV